MILETNPINHRSRTTFFLLEQHLPVIDQRFTEVANTSISIDSRFSVFKIRSLHWKSLGIDDLSENRILPGFPERKQ
ncbi:hypothetical protein L596_024571 [Steinernema carpocapsae]|uniref:Uncharacterized protein n=1 Tax=Steinernema carpocapsae TaxID=34508 RepID=A0A4U5MH69_STECR|nr:hypothetical protein L596_024571 [Steinernema carpocapsae]